MLRSTVAINSNLPWCIDVAINEIERTRAFFVESCGELLLSADLADLSRPPQQP